MENICKKCGTKLVKRETQRKSSQLKQEYYYTAYYFCPNCKKLYHSDKFKVVNGQTGMFALPLRPHPLLKGERIQKEDFDIEIWTDGACVNNGRENAKAAWAFVSGKIEKAGRITGKQTNNVAEALAIYHALQWAIEEKYNNIKIYSDSQITINNLQKPVMQIKQNREIFENIVALIRMHNLTVHYEKVLGHSGDPNNERADRLANVLAGTR